MKIGVQNINKYLQKSLTTEKMVYALEQTEVEVEEILYAKKLDPKIVTASIVKVEPHPNADRLKLVTVSTGVGKKRLVCGGANAKVGLRVAFAQVGSVLPDGTAMASAVIRGENSEGMLCTERELGWGEDHSGVIELDPSLPLGKSLCDIENTTDILDIKTPSNRWDYLSNIGLAREIAATQPDSSLVEPEIGEYAYQSREVVNVKKKEECRVFCSVKLSVKIPPTSPRWVVDNLEAGGMRPINPVVDITNLVMLEYGQPSHAFDSQKLSGPLQVRRAKANESLTTLDGKTRQLSGADLVIADDKGPLDIAGIMGGEKTEIGPNTTEIILTVANFDKTTVRRASLRHGLRTEASNRYEKGLPLPLPRLAQSRLLDLLCEICVAEIKGGPYEQVYAHPNNPWLGMRLRRAEAFLGYKLDEKPVVEGLKKRGFKPTHYSFSSEIKKYLHKPYKFAANAWSDGLDAFDCSYLTQTILAKAGVALPRLACDQYDHGKDVTIYDLRPGDLVFLKGEFADPKQAKAHRNIGHVGMYIGKDKVLQVSSSKGKVVLSPLSLFTKAKDYKGARHYISSFNHIISVEVPWWRTDVTSEVDLMEETAKIMSYDAMPETLPQLPATDTGPHRLLPDLMKLRRLLVARGNTEICTYSFVSKADLEATRRPQPKRLQIQNPLSSEQDFMRGDLVASHLHTVAKNQKSAKSADVFELSRVYQKTVAGVDERWVLGLLVWGPQSLLRLQGTLGVLLQAYGLNGRFERSKSVDFIPGRSGVFGAGKQIFAEFGQIDPALSRRFEVEAEASLAQVEIAQLLAAKPLALVHPALPYQLVERDLTVEIDTDVLWQTVVDSLKDQNHLAKLSFLDEFSNPELARLKRKRLSLRLNLDMGPNPTQKQIETVLAAVVKRLQTRKDLGKFTII